MTEIDRLVGGSDRFELAFVERERTPESAMKLGIRLHLAGLSLSNTISVLETMGVERCRSTVHNWVQKADLQPTDGRYFPTGRSENGADRSLTDPNWLRCQSIRSRSA